MEQNGKSEAMASLERIKLALKQQAEIINKMDDHANVPVSSRTEYYDKDEVQAVMEKQNVKDHLRDFLGSEFQDMVDLDSAEFELNGSEISLTSVGYDTHMVRMASEHILSCLSDVLYDELIEVATNREHAKQYAEVNYKVVFNAAPTSYLKGIENVHWLLSSRYKEIHSLLHVEDLKTIGGDLSFLSVEQSGKANELVTPDFQIFGKVTNVLGEVSWDRVYFDIPSIEDIDNKNDRCNKTEEYDLKIYCNLLKSRYEEQNISKK